ncbi:hypothetical protein KJ707_00965 [Patescibacteria group bacterium]|nr:hypothetical protein [Patescibacteria group bacterium]MBU1967019.1 hypothetical protein [Patescibacteria group bacterium]MBU2543124.1 hypothetical protein [Patescibacteria group bacterium]
MNKKTIILSIFYALGQITQGLLLHPYQTMQSLVRDKVFVWMSFLPVMILGAGIIFGLPLAEMFKDILTLPVFLIDWFIFFCLYWQCLLFYLLVRFFIGFRS